MNGKRFWLLIIGVTSLVFTTQALAHAMLESSSPANKTTLSVAPKTIDLKFGHTTRLTRLKLISAGQETSLVIDPSAPASTTFSVPLPMLKPGAYQVKWSSLAGDGHAMTGRLTFTISEP